MRKAYADISQLNHVRRINKERVFVCFTSASINVYYTALPFILRCNLFCWATAIMNHPRYEKLHLWCGCWMCTWRQWLRKKETLHEFTQKCLKTTWYTNNPDEIEKDYNRYLRKAYWHIVYQTRKHRRRQVARQIRRAYRKNLRLFDDSIVKISLWYTD